MPKNILIVDDHKMVRESIAVLLKGAFPSIRIQEAENGQGALRLIRKERLDLIILDISMPGQDGLFILKEIRKIHSTLPVIVLSVLAEDLYGPRVMKAGASAFVSKCSEAETLIEAVKKVISGGRFISPSLARTIVFDLGASKEPTPHYSLTDEELQVIRLVAEGRKSREIAADINLSENPVAKMRQSIKVKLGLRTKAEIIGYAIRQGIVE